MIVLYNYFTDSHIGEFLALEITDIMERIGINKFAAIVTDNASNCRVARKKIEKIFDHIWDLRCATHIINLILADLVKLDDIKKVISNCEKITKYFKNSCHSSTILWQGFINMKINLEGL